MKKHKTIRIFLALGVMMLLTSSMNLYAQSKAAYKADRFFSIRNYKEALPLYLQAIEEGEQAPLIQYRTGVCLLKNKQLSEQLKAIPYLELAAEKKASEVPDNVHFYLGQILHKEGEVQAAIKQFESFITASADTKNKLRKEVDWQIEMCQNALKFMQKPKKTKIFNFGPQINSEHTEYNPVIAADQSLMAYTVLRPNTDRSKMGFEFKEEINITRKDDGENWMLPEVVNVKSKYNAGTAGISPDGQEMLVFIGSANSTGSVYRLEKRGAEWSEPISFGSKINSKYLETTISITPDGQTVYFASDRPQGYGGLDIYKSEKLENGEWGTAINLGPEVNSKANEDAPFIHPDGSTLFFTSDGHNTMGGNDIFKTVFKKEAWSQPANLGYPINTTNNDSYFTLTADGKRGFFSSDRKGGLGQQDIYWIEMPEEEKGIPLTMVKGRILDGESGDAIPTKIKVVDKKSGKKVYYVYEPEPETGDYLIIFPPGKSYDMIIESEGYMPYTINIEIPNQDYFYELYQQISLKPIKQFDVLVGQKIMVKNAFFDTEDNVKNEKRIAKEAQLVQNDSIDLYELMETIIGTTDSVALEYLLGLMAATNPIDDINFDAKDERLQIVEKVYYYDESDETTLEAKVLENETIYSLPTLSIPKEIEAMKNKKQVVADYDQKLLDRTFKIYFDPNKSDLNEEYQKKLGSLLNVLNKYDALGVEISGYASNDGDADYNHKLSNERAINVLGYFNHRGIVRRRIVAIGHGATGSANDNTDKEKNRRVEIKLVDLNKLDS